MGRKGWWLLNCSATQLLSLPLVAREEYYTLDHRYLMVIDCCSLGGENILATLALTENKVYQILPGQPYSVDPIEWIP